MQGFFDVRRLAAMSAAATLAVGQPLFTLILENAEEFPIGGLFHLWVLVWAWLLPIAGLVAVDALLERTCPRRMPAWTAALCAGTAVSMLHQSFVYGSRRVDLGGHDGLFPASATAVAALAVALALKFPAPTRRYLTVLGVLAVLLAGKYVVGTGLWGPAWASLGMDSAAVSPDAAPTPVVLVVFDELAMDVLLKDDRIDPDRYPHFAAFAAENAWYARATTNHMYTKQAVPCMLTGRRNPAPSTPTLFYYLQGKYVPTFVGGWASLVRIMRRGAGDAARFELRGTMEEFGRRPLEVASLLATCFLNAGTKTLVEEDGTGLLVGPDGASAFGQVDVISQVLSRRAGPGLFLYWHCPLPHSPFKYDPQGKLHGRPHFSFSAEADPGRVLENYRDQVGAADGLFGRFIAALRAAKIYDSAIIVVTGDHGLRTWGPKLQPAGYPAVMNDWTPRVPLLLKAPRVRAGRHDEDYQHMDLAPTLLDLLDVRVDPATFEGTSLLAAERPARPKIYSVRSVDYVFDEVSGLWRRVGD